MVDNKVTKLMYPYCQKVLPLVYDDSLSYYENVCKFIVKLNEMADAINNISVDILDEAKAYTDGKIAETLDEFNAKIAEVQMLINQTTDEFNRILREQDSKYTNFENRVNAQILIFNQALADIRDEINADIIGVNARTDLAIKQNNDYILEEVAKGAVNLKVLNYFTGERVTVQEMFDYLAQFHLQNAASYNQIIASEKTYNEINAIDATYSEWAVNGYNLINA